MGAECKMYRLNGGSLFKEVVAKETFRVRMGSLVPYQTMKSKHYVPAPGSRRTTDLAFTVT